MNKIYTALAAVALMGIAAGISWVAKPNPLPEQLPPEVIRVETVKEIPSPPDTKVVERVVFQTKEVPVDRETIREVVREVDSGGTPVGRVRLEGDQYTSREGSGWKGFGVCEVFVSGNWKELFRSDLDIQNSSAITIYRPIQSKPKHSITVGWDAGDGYLVGYQRRAGWSSRFTLLDVALPDGAGATLIKTTDDVLIFGTVTWEW